MVYAWEFTRAAQARFPKSSKDPQLLNPLQHSQNMPTLQALYTDICVPDYAHFTTCAGIFYYPAHYSNLICINAT